MSRAERMSGEQVSALEFGVQVAENIIIRAAKAKEALIRLQILSQQDGVRERLLSERVESFRAFAARLHDAQVEAKEYILVTRQYLSRREQFSQRCSLVYLQPEKTVSDHPFRDHEQVTLCKDPKSSNEMVEYPTLKISFAEFIENKELDLGSLPVVESIVCYARDRQIKIIIEGKRYVAGLTALTVHDEDDGKQFRIYAKYDVASGHRWIECYRLDEQGNDTDLFKAIEVRYQEIEIEPRTSGKGEGPVQVTEKGEKIFYIGPRWWGLTQSLYRDWIGDRVVDEVTRPLDGALLSVSNEGWIWLSFGPHMSVRLDGTRFNISKPAVLRLKKEMDGKWLDVIQDGRRVARFAIMGTEQGFTLDYRKEAGLAFLPPTEIGNELVNLLTPVYE